MLTSFKYGYGLLQTKASNACVANPKFPTSYLLAYDIGLLKEMARTLEVDEKSIIQWFRDVLVDCYNTTRRESEDLTQTERSLFSWRSRTIAARQTSMLSSRGM
ncbi:hypothetical protein Aduo_006227 [Ancylostoma duodenale]